MISSSSQRKNIEKIRTLLVSAYGHRQWKQRLDPVSELVQTILSQNTSDVNSGKAFNSLRNTYPTWDDIIRASETEIAYAIREGGLSQVKSRYIKNVLEQLKQQQSEFDLTFLNGLPVPEARDWLTQLPGVGMKTASCVLLFSLGMPAFPVDTHVLRVAKRLAVIHGKASADDAHLVLESLVPAENIYEMHMLLITHGRSTCKAQRPHCDQCVLQTICPEQLLK